MDSKPTAPRVIPFDLKGSPKAPGAAGPELPPWIREASQLYGREILAGLAIGLAVVFLVLGYRTYSAMKEERGASALGAAIAEQFGPARVAALEKVVIAHGGTAAAAQAQLLIAASLREAGETGRSLDAFRKAQGLLPGDSVLAASATLGMGYASEAAGDTAAAAEAYRKVMAADNGFKEIALLDLARVLGKAGDREGALSAYNEFLSSYPSSRERPFVEYELARFSSPTPEQKK